MLLPSEPPDNGINVEIFFVVHPVVHAKGEFDVRQGAVVGSDGAVDVVEYGKRAFAVVATVGGTSRVKDIKLMRRQYRDIEDGMQ